MSYEFEPMDRWQSLRQRLAEGPRPQDEVYTFSEGPQEGQQALWTLSGIRADYLEDLLAERDAAVAEVEQLRDALVALRDDQVAWSNRHYVISDALMER